MKKLKTFVYYFLYFLVFIYYSLAVGFAYVAMTSRDSTGYVLSTICLLAALLVELGLMEK